MESTYSEPISRRYITPENARGFGQNMFLGGTLKREVELRSTNQDAWSSSRTNNQLPLFTFEDIGDWTPPATNVFITTDGGGGAGNDQTARVIGTNPISVATTGTSTVNGVTTTDYTASLSVDPNDWGNNYDNVFNTIISAQQVPLLLSTTAPVNFGINLVDPSNNVDSRGPIVYKRYTVQVLTPQLRLGSREWLLPSSSSAYLLDLGHKLPMDVKSDGGVTRTRLTHNSGWIESGDDAEIPTIVMGQKVTVWNVSGSLDYYIGVIPVRLSVECSS